MPWTLEIHHIDVTQGDCTLVIAREVPPLITPGAPIIRSVLIDTGEADQAEDVHTYLTTAQIAALSVLVVTHYDADHFNGTTELLRTYAGRYNNTLIFDQGWPGEGGLDTSYIHYTRAINGLRLNGPLATVFGGVPPPRRRVTRSVLSYGVGTAHIAGIYSLPPANTAAVPLGAPATINQPADWLVGREIMWTDAAGEPDAATYGGALHPAAPGAIGGPPRMRCIAANEHFLQPDGTTVDLSNNMNLNNADSKNARSLAFLIDFEGFRYYLGGDLSTAQEDHANGIRAYLQAQGQVHAMKASHHGSGHASSANFIGLLNPSAVFISCGTDNGHGVNPQIGATGPWPEGHPQQRVLQDLAVRPTLLHYYMTGDRSTADYVRRVNRGIGAWPLGYTTKAIVAGCWGPRPPGANADDWPYDLSDTLHSGHAVLSVSSAAAAAQRMPPPAAAPNFSVKHTQPAVTVPVLDRQLQLPANVVWPNATALPVGTILPANSVWPGGTQAPLQGAVLRAAHRLATPLTWENGQVLVGGTMSIAAVVMAGFRLTADARLPNNVLWANNVTLPEGTILPDGIIIPAGIISPTPLGLTAGEGNMVPVLLPAGVIWPNGVALPVDMVLPRGTVFPANAIWPAGQPLPEGVPADGTVLGVDLTLPDGLIFPVGVFWPAYAPLPLLQVPALQWPDGVALPPGTVLPATATLPLGIQWPPNTPVIAGAAARITPTFFY